jgi:peptidase E
MINILLSDLSICHNEAYENLKEHLKPMSRILVLPYANWEYLQNEENFDRLYNYDYGVEFNDMAKKFYMYGIQKQDICIISPKDSLEFILDKVKRADIIYLSGGCPNQLLHYIPFTVYEALDEAKVILGVSAGAMSQSATYYMYRDYEDETVPLIKRDSYPMGMCYCFDIIMVHYDGNDVQKRAIERHNGRPYGKLLLLRDGQGLIYKDCQLVGEF